MDPIPPSNTDLERRRLESTIDQDLDTLSLASLLTTTASSHPSDALHSHSLTSISSIEYPRAFGEGDTGKPDSLLHPTAYHPYEEHRHGPHGTPRAGSRKVSGMSGMNNIEDSPVSTAGHHVSAVTLGEGLFRTKGGQWESGDEFDPERSLGRLVGELGKAMGSQVSPRPTSPFSALSPPRSPRSPSPLSSLQHQQRNLSLTLNRNDPLPSPPASRSASGSSEEFPKHTQGSRFSSLARDLAHDVKARNAMADTTRHNEQARAPIDGNKQKDRYRSLYDERRPSSAPARVIDGDITGMTGLMATPAKGGEYDSMGKNADVAGHDAGSNIPQALAMLQARLRALETEASLSRRRVRELENELDQARDEVNVAKRSHDIRLREVIGEKSALEDLIKSLRSHLARLTVDLEQNKNLIAELRQASHRIPHDSPPRVNRAVADELAALRREIERLSREIQRLGGVVEQGLETRRKARSERTMRVEAEEAARLVSELNLGPQREDTYPDQEELRRVARDVQQRQSSPRAERFAPPPTPGPSKFRQGLHAAAVDPPTLMPPTVQPATRVRARHNPTPPPSDEDVSPLRSSASARAKSRNQHSKPTRKSRPVDREEGPESPFPSIRAEDETEFFAALDSPRANSPWSKQQTEQQARKTSQPLRRSPLGETTDNVPPQTVLARVLRELEEDFVHYKAIYAELADQYKVLDASSAVAKRHVLAEHLKEVIDTLEQKADQIASLYDLLTVQDRPARPDEFKEFAGVKKSVPDILRMVRETVGDEGMKRLEREGVGRKRHKIV